MMQRLEYVLARNIDSPFQKNSVFFETFIVPPEDFDKITETKETERIKYTFILCKSGVEVFDRYEKKEVEPKEFKVFYEEDSPDKSNFFGTACRVKMSKEAKDFFTRISLKNQPINFRGVVYDYLNLKDLDGLVKILAKEKKINETLLKGAIYLEIAEESKLNETFKKVFSLNNQLADWIRGGIEAIEKWKFTEENYDYQTHYVEPMYSNLHHYGNPKVFPGQEVKYKPIIPVPISAREYRGMQNASEIAASGFNKLKGFADYFGEISTAAVLNIVKATPTITDDIFFAVVFYVKNFIEDRIPESIKNVYIKLKTFFKEISETISEIGKFIGVKINREIAKVNAFLCGLLNGLISLAQTIIMLLAMITDNLPFLEMEKLSPAELAKHQEKLEFIEDFVDLFAENSKEFLAGIKNLFSEGKIWKEISRIIDGLKKKFLDLNEFFWAYFIGAVAFELILDVVIAYFTGGASLVGKASEKIAQAAGKISRITAKLEQLGAKGVQFSKNLGKKIANTAQDLYKWLEKEFLELVEAVKIGNIEAWIKKKIDTIFGEGNKPLGELLGLNDNELDWMATRRLDELGGKILTAKQIRRLRGILKEKGITLIMEDDIRSIKRLFKPVMGYGNVDDLFYFMKKYNIAGGFDAVNRQLVLPRDVSELVAFHEMSHVKHFEQLEDVYHTLSTLEKETYVWEQTLANRHRWTKTEFEEALDYINRIREDYKLGPIIIK
ncbi:exonuclease VII small subunit [Chryseobacterium defluvii]|uniref:Exonuclease VII small subunit n=1 Tax=Chryseobacterium defluvii TaxID=160396 RepID=A0A840KC23_9FLAO|nr:zincin-like metallopeptidase toxin domain-containing protein [Chryseobacterium defluvii]MBB4806951.1 exonuclease VII small subunit [Chryseobacterium defluvii]